jgi:hypothetical protein
MKQILTEWRKFVTENKKKMGTIDGGVGLWTGGLYSPNGKQRIVGKEGEKLEVEIISGWQDQGVESILIRVVGLEYDDGDPVEGWVDAGAVDTDMEALSEEDNLEQNLYSFDFDNTLIRYHTLEDGDVEYLGPHEENIALLKDLAAQGNKVIIVTSRSPLKHPKYEWDKAPTPEEAIQEFGLPIEEVHYTYGNLKADKLMELGVTKHWDDDDDEIAAAWAAGIEAVVVPVEGDVTDRLRDKWKDHIQEIDKHSTNN